MPDKKQVLIESIQKLKKLGVSEDEIRGYLTEFGIKDSDASALIAADSKGQAPRISSSPDALRKAQKGLEKSVALQSETVSQVPPKKNRSNSDSLVSSMELPGESMESFDSENAEERTDSSADLFGESPSRPMASSSTSVTAKALPMHADMSELWEKGIMKTVTDSLLEMRRIRDELDSVLDSRIHKVLDKEVEKLQSMQESMRTLLMAKVNAELDRKTKEVIETLDQRIADLKIQQQKAKEQQDLLKTEQKLAQDLFKQLSDELTRFRSLRDKSISEFNSESIKSKSLVSEVVEDSQKKLLAIEERATKTLQLESAIVEGMVKDGQNRIDRLALAKIDELSAEVSTKLAEFEAASQRSGVDGLAAEIESLKSRIKQLESHAKKKSTD